jgi:uncharacterized protein
MKIQLWILVLSLFAAARPASAQGIQVNSANRTISVTATESLRVSSELAVVHLGVESYGKTKDEAFSENTKAANNIVKALLDANVSQTDLETESLEVSEVDSIEPSWSAQEKKDRKFRASQGWAIRVTAQDAQRIVDIAVAAGADKINNVEWIVSNPRELEQKAADTALAKARGIAEQMAQQMGVKVGAVLFVSNETSPSGFEGLLNPVTRSGLTVYAKLAPAPMLKLFPQKVEKTATVYAVFAMD